MGRIFSLVCLGSLAASALWAVPSQIGDLDEDGTFTAQDLALLSGHVSESQKLPEAQALFADLDQDGVVNQRDQELLVELILETKDPMSLPLASVRRVSPYRGEADVAVTRETIVEFTLPLELGASLDTEKFFAVFGERKILSRVELSSDRRRATLFYLEPLPSSARIRVKLEGADLRDLLGRSVDLDGDGNSGGNFGTEFDTLTITALNNTGLIGRVLASEPGEGGVDIPIAGATITVDGAEQTLRAVTDAQGNFNLSPCPSGSFFVHIDGRTSPASSYPSGDYYPSVGKRWEAVAGRLDNLSGNAEDSNRGVIYLPIIVSGTLVTLSAQEPTAVELPASVLMERPELEGLELSVPANALFSDDGQRGGKVGIAPVAPERLPGPLPEGLSPTMVITIQSDGGTNFDRPVPVCFPNLPDPVTQQLLAPGEKTALVSFNHDTGNWEVVGSMTVTEDGQLLKTDAGVGVRQPGWHAPANGSGGSGGGPAGAPNSRRGRPSPNSPNPPCDKRSGWDWAVLLFDIGKEMVSCGAQFTRLEEAFKCGLGIGDSLRTYLQSAQDYEDAVNGVQGISQSEQALNYMDNSLNAANALVECAGLAGSVASLSDNLNRVYGCLGNVVNIGDSICQFRDDPNASAPCRAGPGELEICAGISLAKMQLANLKNYLDLVANFEKAAVMATAKFVVSEAKLAMDTVKRGRDLNASSLKNRAKNHSPFSEPPLTVEERALLLGPMKKLKSVNAELAKLPSIIAGANQALRELQNFSNTILNKTSKSMEELGEPSEVACFYRLFINDQTRRGKTSSSGSLSLILPPESVYEIAYYNPATREFGSTIGRTGRMGSSFPLNRAPMQPIIGLEDGDSDGLPDMIEAIVGTLVNDPDSDDDSILDGTEVDQGTDPNSNIVISTGVIAAVPTSGPALDLSAAADVLATANGEAGVSFYHIGTGFVPVRIADFPTPSRATNVHLTQTDAVVSDDQRGILLFDINDRANIRLVKQFYTQDQVTCLASNGSTLFAGLANGKIFVVDLTSRSLINRLSAPEHLMIEDITVWRDNLYYLQNSQLISLSLADLESQNILALANRIGAAQGCLFAGDGTLYVTHAGGIHLLNTTSSPGSPTLHSHFTLPGFGLAGLALNGSGTALMAYSPNSSPSADRDIDIFQMGADERNPTFSSTEVTPGSAKTVKIYNGLGYVADGNGGLQIIGYLPFDQQEQAPQIALDSNVVLNHQLRTGTVEGGKLTRLSALVSDDVQVREVRFFIDGKETAKDGSYPFEFSFTSPKATAQKTQFRVRATAVDTGGNLSQTEEYVFHLVPDTSPPSLLRVAPLGITGKVSSLFAYFNEEVDAGSITPQKWQLTFAGPDAEWDTADDEVIAADRVAYRADLRAAVFERDAELPVGQYRAEVKPGILDLSGNSLMTGRTWNFTVEADPVFWVGTTSGSWNDPTRWSNGRVPTAQEVVVIDGSPSMEIHLQEEVSAKSITVNGGAVLRVPESSNVHFSPGLHLNHDVIISQGGSIFLTGDLILVSADLIFEDVTFAYLRQSIQSVQNTSLPAIIGEGQIITSQGGFYGVELLNVAIGEQVSILVREKVTAQIDLQGTMNLSTPNAWVSLTSSMISGTVTVHQGQMNWHGQMEADAGSFVLSDSGQIVIHSEIVPANLAAFQRAGGSLILRDQLDLQNTTYQLSSGVGLLELDYGSITNGTLTAAPGAGVLIKSNKTGTLRSVDLQAPLTLEQGATLFMEEEWVHTAAITGNQAKVVLRGSYALSEIGPIVGTGNILSSEGILENAGHTLNMSALPNFFEIGNGGTVLGGTVTASAPFTMPGNRNWIFDGVLLAEDLLLSQFSRLTVKNGLTLQNANIAAAADEVSSSIEFTGTQMLSGTGKLLFDGFDGNAALAIGLFGGAVEAPATLTIGSGIEVHFGSTGRIFTLSGSVTNQGDMFFAIPPVVGDPTIGVEVEGNFLNLGSMNISGGRLFLGENQTEANWTNQGTMLLSGTGELRLRGSFTQTHLGTLTRTGGMLVVEGELTNTSTLTLNAASGSWVLKGTIKGSSLQTTEGSVLIVNEESNAFTALDGVNILGTVQVQGGVLSLLGDWQNHGVIQATNSDLKFGGSFALTDLGTIQLTNSFRTLVGTLENAAQTFIPDSSSSPWRIFGGTIQGGILSSQSGTLDGSLFVNTVLDGVTLGSDFTITSASFSIINGLQLGGRTLTLDRTQLNFTGTQVLSGSAGSQILLTGTSFFSSPTLRVSLATPTSTSPSILTIGSGVTVIARTDAYLMADSYGANQVINQGILRADTSEKTLFVTGSFVNQGQLQQVNGGAIVFY